MTTAIIAFACGIVWLQWQAELPATDALTAFALLGGALCALAAVHRRLHAAVPIGMFLLGIGWAGMQATLRLADALPKTSEGRDIEIVGVVVEMPQAMDRGLRFRFAVESATLPVPQRISLAWYGARPFSAIAGKDTGSAQLPVVHVGERWGFRVRLKRPHGNVNPGGFDYEGWLFERGIRATGYVRDAGRAQRIDTFVATPGNRVERLRESIRDRYQAVLGDRPYTGILIALAIGDQQAIAPVLWQSFARTGVTHLMSISGLHVTMVAGLFYAVASFLWRRSRRLPLYLPAQQAAAIAGILAAFAYCLLAGFAVPAQRTLYMLSVVALASLLRRRLPARQVLSQALLLVLLLDPWAVLSAGFWLSFAAVGLLLFISTGAIARRHWLVQWGRAQWAMALGLLPLLLVLFQQFSLLSPLANAVAIPLVSFVVTPLTLLAALPGLQFLLWPAHWLTAQLMLFIHCLAALPWAVWQQHAPTLWAVGAALVGTLWLLLPRGMPARWVGLVFYLPLFLLSPPRPAPGDMRVVVLDVGQGLAVHVQTRSHDLLFDTGPSFSPDADSGTRVLVPYLRAGGVRRLDGLVVSHEDNDHAGGADSVIQAVPTRWLLSSLPVGHPLSAVPQRHMSCVDGQRWRWDGVVFEVLYPQPQAYLNLPRKTNNMSCVIRVTSAHGSVLLTGDIEAVDERRLLSRHADALRSDVLVVPHHGSNTSSTAEFLSAVGASRAVFSAGYRNRFGHPRPKVLERYRARNATLFRNDEDGAVTFDFSAKGISVQRQRTVRKRYWQGA
jgi:competence protein ComEC